MNNYEEIYHYGILGMKWGVRRFQDKNGRLTSAGKKRYSRGESMNTEDPSDSEVTRQVKKDYNNLSDSEFKQKYQGSKNTYRKRVNRYGDPYMNAPLAKLGKEASSKPPLTEEEIKARNKKILIGLAIGAGVAVAAGAAYYAVKKSKNVDSLDPDSIGEGKSALLAGGKFKSTFISDPSKLSDSEFESELSDQVRSINKGGMMAALFLEDRSQNCQFCTTAYELNRRGLDVSAQTRELGGDFTNVERWFKNPQATWGSDGYKKFMDEVTNATTVSPESLDWFSDHKTKMAAEDVKRFSSSLLAQGEGARGNIQGSYATKLFGDTIPVGGHSIAYEVHNNNLYVIDGQTGKWYKNDKAEQYIGKFMDCMSYRTDNCELNSGIKETYTTEKGLSNESINYNSVLTYGTLAVSGAIGVSSLVSSARDELEYRKELRRQEENKNG